ncbi:MAG: polyprenyl synthetase family protein [Candidatus Azobacteroides sp.]|nr:polyprenyl synthetase family protein [Candidatus Azobacteroides sp.]
MVSYIVKKEKEIILFDQSPQKLYEPIEYILSLGGKKIRPALTLLAFNMFSDNMEKAVCQALAIEVFHNFTLMHDDLMDRAEVRRGKPVVYKVWNENTAILSGDAMLIMAYQLVARCPSHLLPDILNLFSVTAMEVCKGQQYDMEFETRRDVTKPEYLEMIRLKTAVLLGCALKMGAILGDATPEDTAYLYDFGINIGLAFQLKDDLLDVYGDPAVFGKNIGGDILCNKKTFLLITALENANRQQKEKLEYWLSQEACDKEEKIKEVTFLYNETKAKADCEFKMEEYYQAAIHCLDMLSIEPERKKELKLLADSLMERRS